MARVHQEPLRSFVRGTLGCGCPDELLRSMHLAEPQPLPGLTGSCRRLEVGGRLLVLVVNEQGGGRESNLSVRPGVRSTLSELIRTALQLGIGERDRLGFNRLRLVLATRDPGTIEDAARSAFSACRPPDERCHLHVIHHEDLPEGLR